MGWLRLLLATCVVAFHTGGLDRPFFMLSGTHAVEAFFLISGYFMAAVLDTKYRGQPKRLFYFNRVLRLFPAYLVILVLFCLAKPILLHGVDPRACGFACMGHDATPRSDGNVALWVLTNIFIVGKEVWLFNGAGWDGLFHALASPPGPEAIAAMRSMQPYQVVAQAWSLSLELQFYLLAPFLVRWSIGGLIALCGASLALRLGLFGAGYAYEPFVYYALPGQLCFFLFGVLSYRLSPRWRNLGGQRLRWALIAGMTVFTVMFPSRLDGLPQIDPNRVVYMACLFLVLPMLSRPTATSRIDRICGDLSYPVYIVHLPLLAVLASLGLEPPYGGFAPFAVLMVPTLVLSAMLLYAVDRPIDRFRERATKRTLLVAASVAPAV